MCIASVQAITTPAVHFALLQTLIFYISCFVFSSLNLKSNIFKTAGTGHKCGDNVQPAEGRCGIIESREEQRHLSDVLPLKFLKIT